MACKIQRTQNQEYPLHKKRYPSGPSPFSLGATQIEEVTTHKHLGLHFNKEGNWSHHIDASVTKANTALNIPRKLKYVMDRGSLLTLYNTQIRPIMEYADCVWINLVQHQKDRLEELQLEAMIIITGAPRGTHPAKLYTEVGLESLDKRRKNHQLVLYYKMENNLAPPYLSLRARIPQHQPQEATSIAQFGQHPLHPIRTHFYHQQSKPGGNSHQA